MRLRSLPSLLVVTALAAGCGKPPPEAPAELGELSLYLFSQFDGEDGEELIAGVQGLEDWLLGLEDLKGNVDDRAVTLPVLTSEHWGGVTGAETAPEEQLPIGVGGVSGYGMKEQIELVAETNYVCIESNTTKYYAREFLSEIDCFVDGTCDRVDTENEIRKESFLAKVWFDVYKDHRVITLEDDRQVMFARSWMPRPYPGDGGNTSWDQLYSLEAWIPHPEDDAQTLRYFAFWSSVTGIDNGIYLGAAKSGIAEGYTNADAFIGGDDDYCNNPRDREYDRPE